MTSLRLSLVLAALVVSSAGAARAQSCMTLRYVFQPDCYRPDDSSGCVESKTHMELGPQIAVWLQDGNGAFGYVSSTDGTRKDGTLMVTNAVARRGIGNRPGRWDFLSGPLFPYGKRVMALPIWAHARGVTYPTVNMAEADCVVGGPGESCLGWHESWSSPEPYYCRPLTTTDLDSALGVDAISCPTKFNSEKGKLDATAPSYYPPRSDLTTFAGNDTGDPPTYATLNDLDTVAAATPAFGKPVERVVTLPPDLPAGDYTLMVEVNKEYDVNSAHTHPDYADPHLVGYGTDGNFGQPSVVYEVPLHVDLSTATMDAQAASQISGYGDWTGATGVVNPPDATISTADLGSGEARLLLLTDATTHLSGRVIASVSACTTLVCDVNNVCSICDPRTQQCTPLTCSPLPAAPTSVADLTVADDGLTASTATLAFKNAESNGAPVLSYDIRYRDGTSMTDDQFSSSASAPQVTPGPPGAVASFTLSNLKPGTEYAVGVRAVDPCGQTSPLVTTTFSTPAKQFTQLSGCFIATAAWGSAMAPDVAAMRQARDRLRPASTMFAVATDLYYRAGPAAAALLARSDTARALVRRVLAPVGTVAQVTSLRR